VLLSVVSGVAHPVGLAVGDDDGGVVQEPVQDAGRGGVFGKESAPLNWNWHTFVWDQMFPELLILGLGVSAGFQGGSAVC
jgi:hypothetical protein